MEVNSEWVTKCWYISYITASCPNFGTIIFVRQDYQSQSHPFKQSDRVKKYLHRPSRLGRSFSTTKTGVLAHHLAKARCCSDDYLLGEKRKLSESKGSHLDVASDGTCSIKTQVNPKPCVFRVGLRAALGLSN
jgi:hypothetical protein